jgi:kynurenine formamidase
MCSPEVMAHVAANMGPADRPAGGPTLPEAATTPRVAVSFSTVVDLTHPLVPDFPTPFGRSELEIESVLKFADHRWNLNRWHINEHMGTHIDAPIHVVEGGLAVEQIPIGNLVVPLAVVDIRERAATDPDTELTPDDLAAWESQHGPLPRGCCVAMNSGWDTYAPGKRYCDRDEDGVMHFPGLHPEAAEMLANERDVVGVGVDTTSLDHGPSTEHMAHRIWMPAGGWIVEGLANLSELPPAGATIVVGGPTVVGATGGVSRIIALV